MVEQVDRYICDACFTDKIMFNDAPPMDWVHFIGTNNYSMYGYNISKTIRFDFCSEDCRAFWLEHHEDWV